MKYTSVLIVAVAGVLVLAGCPRGSSNSQGQLHEADYDDNPTAPEILDERDSEIKRLRMENDLLLAEKKRLEYRETQLSEELRKANFEKRLIAKQLTVMNALIIERDQARERVKQLEAQLKKLNSPG